MTARPGRLAAVTLGAALTVSVPATTDTTTPDSSATETTDASATTDAADTTSSAPDTTVVSEPVVMPLTGALVPFGQVVPERAALVVKIDNAPAARPQSGLDFADIVFEEVVEGDITRFAAVFHSQGANPVGPIRSGRTQDVDLLSGLMAPLFVWSGGNGGVTQAINDSDFVSIPDGTENFFYRSSDNPRPHNLYANTDPIWEHYAWSVVPPPAQFQYVANGQTATGEPASFVELMMGGIPVRWDYDAATGLYTRQQQGRTHQLVEGPATTDNVVIMLTTYGRSPADPRSPEAVTVGEGIVYALSDGTLQVGRWERADRTSPITLTNLEGEPILLGPGRTWVELAKTDNHDTVTG